MAGLVLSPYIEPGRGDGESQRQAVVVLLERFHAQVTLLHAPQYNQQIARYVMTHATLGMQGRLCMNFED